MSSEIKEEVFDTIDNILDESDRRYEVMNVLDSLRKEYPNLKEEMGYNNLSKNAVYYRIVEEYIEKNGLSIIPVISKKEGDTDED